MKINQKTTALIVIDMQNDFYGVGGNADIRGKSLEDMRALGPKITEFADKLRGQGVTIVYTKFLYDPVKSPNNFKELIGEEKNSNFMCKAGTLGAEFDGVMPQLEDVVIEKYSYDAFAGTNLKKILQEKGIDTLIITGVRSEVCVSATANRAFAEGYRTIVVSDLIATSDDKRDLTKSILKSLRYSCRIIDSAKPVANS